MSRRPVNSARRSEDTVGTPPSSPVRHNSQTSPLLRSALLVLGVFALVAYFYSGIGRISRPKETSRDEVISCSGEVQKAIPLLKSVYGESMRKVLHVGPNTCLVTSELAKEEGMEAWGVEPYGLEYASTRCKKLVRTGVVRWEDIKFPLPYKANSFSLLIVSDALDYMSTKYLNRTLPDLARLATDGLVVFSGYPGQPRAPVLEMSKFKRQAKLRSSSWWNEYFGQSKLKENVDAIKKFEEAATKFSYKSSCQIFHLKSFS